MTTNSSHNDSQDNANVKKARKTVKLIDEYTEILKGGTLLVCPITGISFTMPTFSRLPSVYMDMRHPLGVASNYPAIYAKHHMFKELNQMELAGIILATFSFYGKVASTLSVFKQNEVLRSSLSKHELLAFLEWLNLDFITNKGQASAFTIEEDFNPLYLYSYQYTCWAIKNNVGFDTLTVKEAIEKKVLLVGSKDTIKNMTSDLRIYFRSNVAPFVAQDIASKVESKLSEALTSANDDLVERIIKALDKRMEGAFKDFFAEFRKYRAYFERACLVKQEDEMDLSFDSPTDATQETQEVDVNDGTHKTLNKVVDHENSKNSIGSQQAIGQSTQSSSGKPESLLERIARLRGLARNG